MPSSATGPRYRAIAETLRTELAAGRYPLGSVFPKELALCERFGVSRFTVRGALSELEQAGLVERRKARGTIVTGHTPRRAYVQSLTSLEALLQYPAETRLEPVLERELAADASLAERFGCKPGAPLVCFGAVRLGADGREKLCWTDVFVLPEYAGIGAELGRDARPVYRVIEDVHGVTAAQVDVDLEADALDAETAARLDAEPGTPALRIVRRYADEHGRVFEVSVSRHPRSRFTYSMSFRRREQGEADAAAVPAPGHEEG